MKNKRIADCFYWDRSDPEIPGCLSVCVSVFVCVCLSVHASMPKPPGRLQQNHAKMVPLRSCAFVFQLISIINDVAAAIFNVKTVALSGPQF